MQPISIPVVGGRPAGIPNGPRVLHPASNYGYGFYLFNLDWKRIIVGTFFVMTWSGLTLPGIFALIGDNLPQTRRSIGFGVQSTLKRIPIVLASPLGGWFIASLGLVGGMKLGLEITIILALLSIVVVLHYYVEHTPPSSDKIHFGDISRLVLNRLIKKEYKV